MRLQGIDMKKSVRILAYALAGTLPLLITGCASHGPVSQKSSSLFAPRPAEVKPTLERLLALIAAQPQPRGTVVDTGKTASGLPKLYGVTARALKKSARADEVAELQRLYQIDADNGDRIAQWSVAKIYEDGLGREVDLAAAMTWFHKAAEAGDTDAMNQIGYKYHNGVGVELDRAKAVEWFRKAADLGNATAQYNLGMRYLRGEGVDRNERQAAEWLLRAADQGESSAQYELALLKLKGGNTAAGHEWLARAVAQGNAAAMAKQGELTLQGKSGFRQSKIQALTLLKQSAESGDAVGMNSYAHMLERGSGTARDIPAANFWYYKAAVNGEPAAQLRLADLYEAGKVLPQDGKEVARWLKEAANNGNPEAQYRYAELLRTGRYLAKNEVEARHWREKAAAQGYKPRTHH